MNVLSLSAVSCFAVVSCFSAKIDFEGTTETKTLDVAPTSSKGISSTTLGSVSGDVRRLEYKVSDRHRLFLFTPTLDTHASSGALIQMPQSPVDESLLDVTMPFPTAWRSARVFDIGLCGASGTWGSVATALADGFTKELRPSAAALELTSASVTPLFRQSGSAFDDKLHFAGRWTTGSIGGCTNTTIALDFDFKVRRTSPTHLVAPSTTPPSAACAGIPAEGRLHTIPNDGDAFDFEAQILPLGAPAVFVDIGDICLAEPSIRGSIEGSIKTGFPKAFARGIQSATTLPRTAGVLAGVPNVACTCDLDCTASAVGVPGNRHRCVRNLCEVQLEPERLDFRPEGLGVVLADLEEDFQAGFYEREGVVLRPRDQFCDPNRLRAATPRIGSLPGTVAAP